MHAVSRLLGSASEEDALAVVDTLVVEARGFFRVCSAILISIADGSAEITAMDPPDHAGRGPLPSGLPQVADMLGDLGEAELLEGERALALGRALGLVEAIRAALVLPMRARTASSSYVLMLADTREKLELQPADLEVARGFAAAASAGLEQLYLATENAAQTARHAALARAARTLNESLDLNRVLVRMCEEAARMLEADSTSVFLGNADGGLRLEATSGLPSEALGKIVRPGEGLVGRVLATGRSANTNSYQTLDAKATIVDVSDVRAAMAVPMHWDGELRGALAVGYTEPHEISDDELRLLEALAELAAAACRNASTHAGLMRAARTDALTGCLNHAAFHETLRLELERVRRSGSNLSLALVDLDHFKQVNERHGHLAGDEVLRQVGRALRVGVRTYDVVARYGGDEFAVLTVDADETEAAEVASRAIAGVREALEELGYPDELGGATAGVAQARRLEDATSLIERADEALLRGKQHGRRGEALRASELVDG